MTEPRSAPKLDCHNLPSIRAIGVYKNELVGLHGIADLGVLLGCLWWKIWNRRGLILGVRVVVGVMTE